LKKGAQGDGGGQPPIVFDAEQISQIEKLGAVLSKGQLADYLEISENTFRAIEQRQPEVLAAYKKGKSKALASVASNLINQAQNGNTTAAIFYMKTQGRWRESTHLEVDAKVSDVTGMSDAELADIARGSSADIT